ncbi:MAG: hypothetical protein M3450_20315 [Actinomycetota bacterium]|nr:hypothetical protein [Actinomycetota bacterium]
MAVERLVPPGPELMVEEAEQVCRGGVEPTGSIHRIEVPAPGWAATPAVAGRVPGELFGCWGEGRVIQAERLEDAFSHRPLVAGTRDGGQRESQEGEPEV